MIAFSIGFMIYFSATDSSSGSEIALACGSTVAVIATLIMYLIRKTLLLKVLRKASATDLNPSATYS